MAAGNVFRIGAGVELQLVQGDITQISVARLSTQRIRHWPAAAA